MIFIAIYPAVACGTLAVLILIIVAVYRYQKRQNNNQSSDSSAAGFVSFACNYAQEQQVPKNSKEAVQNFFQKNFNMLKLAYVSETRQPLILNNIPRTLQVVIQTYMKG